MNIFEPFIYLTNRFELFRTKIFSLGILTFQGRGFWRWNSTFFNTNLCIKWKNCHVECLTKLVVDISTDPVWNGKSNVKNLIWRVRSAFRRIWMRWIRKKYQKIFRRHPWPWKLHIILPPKQFQNNMIPKWSIYRPVPSLKG